MPKSCRAHIVESLESRLLLSVVGDTFSVASTVAAEGSYSIAFDGTNFLLAVEQDREMSAQLITPVGTPLAALTSTKRFGQHTEASFGGQPLVAFGGGKYLMVWGDSASQTHDIWGTFISTTGEQSGSPFPISQGTSEEQTAGIAFDGTRFFVVYLKDAESGNANTKVAGRFVSTAGAVSSETVISSGFGDQVLNNVAFDGNNFLVVWNNEANGSEIRGRFVSQTGTLGTEFSVNNSAAPSNTPCTLGFDGANYLVVWADQVGPDADDWDLFGQRVTPAGGRSGSIITVTNANGRQIIPFIAFDGVNWLVTWNDFRNDVNGDFVDLGTEGTFADIYGVFINRLGSKVGREFAIANTTGWQFGGAVAFGRGRYSVVWNDGTSLDFSTGQFNFSDVIGARVSPIPSATFSSGALNITGTADADNISLAVTNGKVRVDLGNRFTQDFTAASITSISIDAREGNDVVMIGGAIIGAYVLGGSGDDRLIGGDGNDSLTGAAGKDQLTGNGGNDVLNGAKHADVIFGGDGNDRLYGGEADDAIDGGLGSDRIYGGTGNDRIFGGNQNDIIYGEEGDDFIDAGLHNDRIYPGPGRDSVIAGKGNDAISSRDNEIDDLDGGEGEDIADADAIDLLNRIES